MTTSLLITGLPFIIQCPSWHILDITLGISFLGKKNTHRKFETDASDDNRSQSRNAIDNSGISFVSSQRISYQIQPLALIYSLTDNWEELRHWHAMTLRSDDKKHEITVHVTLQRMHTRMKALVIAPYLDWSSEEAEWWYNKEFNIKTGYRDKHQFLARTSSKTLAGQYLILLFTLHFLKFMSNLLFYRESGEKSFLATCNKMASGV